MEVIIHSHESKLALAYYAATVSLGELVFAIGLMFVTLAIALLWWHDDSAAAQKARRDADQVGKYLVSGEGKFKEVERSNDLAQRLYLQDMQRRQRAQAAAWLLLFYGVAMCTIALVLMALGWFSNG